MNSTQIKCFLSLAKTLNFTQTSYDLFLSEPTVSKSIAKLEKEIGTQLFERHYHRICLTQDGQYFYYRIQTISHDITDTLDRLKDKQVRTKTTIKLGYTCLAFEQERLPIAIRLAHRHDNIYISATSFNPGKKPDLTNVFKSGQLDILILQNDYFVNQPEVTFTPFFKKDFSVITLKRSDLALNESLSLNEIVNQNVYVWNSMAVSPIIENFKLKLTQHQPTIRFTESSDLMTLLAYVRAGLGIVVCPSVLFDKNNTDLRYVPLNLNSQIPYGANYLKQSNKKTAIQSCLKAIKTAVKMTKNRW